MCTRDAAGYRGEAPIGLILIFKAVCRDRNLVNLALPLPYELCAGFEFPLGVTWRFGVQTRRYLL